MATNESGYDELALIKDLKAWWDDQVATPNDPFAHPKPAAGTIYDAIPEIDSLGAVIGLVTIEKHLPFQVPVRVIRRGGYRDFEDLVGDLMPKLRALAEQYHAKKPAKTTANTTAAAPEVP